MKKLFYLSLNEKNGILFFILIVLVTNLVHNLTSKKNQFNIIKTDTLYQKRKELELKKINPKKKEILKNVEGKKKEDKKKNLKKQVYKPNAKKVILLEINSATPKQLEKVYGIGKILSERIVKYKNILGGYHSINQLKNVYGFSEKNYTNAIKQLRVDSSKIKKINIKKLSAYELSKHILIDYSMAKRIKSIQKNNISRAQFIDSMKYIFPSKYKDLIPYLLLK